ncbi:IS3 family transposase [Methanobrevibacter sp.]|uniref:IS3 family transposase n=1 Tax=Methanobrevibacter sp. TaxID=66852 RepID=UPI0038676888
MRQNYTEQQKLDILKRCQNGESILLISKETNISRSTIYRWLSASLKKKSPDQHSKEPTYKDIRKLEHRVQHLEGMFEVIELSGCTSASSLKDRLNALEKLYGRYNTYILCEALKVPRGTFYNHILRNKREKAWYYEHRKILKAEIQRVYHETGQIYGSDKITAILKEQGIKTPEDTVRLLMKELGLKSIRQQAKALYEKEKKGFCQDKLKQNFYADKPNQIWVSDVTYFKTKSSAFSICVIMDLYSRMIVAYKIGTRNNTRLIKGTFKLAYESRKPADGLLFHSDRGSNYRAAAFTDYLKTLNVEQSFSRAHVPYDNSVVESFFANFKREELYRRKYRSDYEFRQCVNEYILFYNMERPHSSNNYKTPLAKELEYKNKIKKS